MKKSIFILFLIFLSGCSGQAQEQRFVNPLFYETLEPISTTAWQTKLTPTQAIITNTKIGYSKIRDCELLENTQESVSLKCQYRDNPDILPSIYTYKIIPQTGGIIYDGTKIVEMETELDGSFDGKSFFVIRNKE